MKVPEVVQTTRKMMVHIAIDGPESQSHQESPSMPWSASAAGGAAGSTTPRPPSTTQTRPRASVNQFGPLMPTHLSRLLTAPLLWKRKRNTVETAIELVTDGK